MRAYAAKSGYSNEVSAVVPTTTAPVASFTANGSTASSLNVTQGQSMTFTDTSTGTVGSCSWSLGDGTSATSSTVVKSYSTTGTRAVTLSVTGAGVTRTPSKTINVTAAPVATFSATPLSGTVQFTDASTDSISSRSWSFGTGGAGTSQNPSYKYSSRGTYTGALTANVSGGSNRATKTGYITVGSTSGGGSGGTAVSTAGLVGAYGFDKTSDTQVADASGKGNHGTLSNVTRASQGGFGRALSFNGSDSLVTVNDSNSLDLTNAMTLSAWVYPTSPLSGWWTLVLKEPSRGLTYALYANSNGKQPCSDLYIGGADRSLCAGSNLPINTWSHVATTYDGTTQRLYVNGYQVGSRSPSGTLAVSANPLRIGGNAVWGDHFQGLLDGVRVHSRALPQAEISVVAQQPVIQSAPAASACASSCSFWNNATTPSVAATEAVSAQELGVRCRSDVAGQVTGVRFYKGNGNTGTHLGRLWSVSGQLLAQATFTNESASGWQQVNFASPVAIQEDNTYVVSYYAPKGHHAYDRDYFSTGYASGPLHAFADGKGICRYGGGLPSASYRSTN